MQFLPVYDPVIGVEHWTSATDEGSDGNFVWCNGKTSVNMNELNWKGGEPNLAHGNCAFVQFSNSSANWTTFSLGDCAQKKRFICEVKVSFNNLTK